MSGPCVDEQLYEVYSGSLDWNQSKVNDLRQLADRVDNGLLVGDDDDLPNEQIAMLLRAKADQIEAALRTIENATHEDYNALVRAIQYNYSGDWGVEKVEEAWENYGEKNE